MDDVLDMCLYTVCKHFIGDSVIYVHQGHWPSSYVYEVALASLRSLEESLFQFLNNTGIFILDL